MKNRSKQEARRIVMERLALLTPGEYTASAEVVRQHTFALLSRLHDEGTLRTVLSYRAASKWHEIDARPLENELKGVAFDYLPIDTLAPFPSADYDAVLVPLFGYRDDGYRLGHGSGWYDRFLTDRLGIYKIGLGLEAGRVDFAPEAHDVPMDIILTEYGPLAKD